MQFIELSSDEVSPTFPFFFPSSLSLSLSSFLATNLVEGVAKKAGSMKTPQRHNAEKVQVRECDGL